MKRKSLSSNTQRELQQQQQVWQKYLSRKHAATTAAIRNEETEILEQRAAVTAARQEATIDGKDQQLLTLIERRKSMDRKDKGKVRDISKMIKR